MRPVGPNDPRQIGPYRLTHLLGQGGMGQVFLGRTRGGWDVVVKIIRPDRLYESDSRSPEYRARFAREAQAARSVGGFYTAHVLDADPHAEQPWIASAYIPGPTLSRAVRDQGPLAPPSARRLAARLAEGLLAIHAHGLIHRDLKPANIILADDGPKIIDFGIARPLDNTAISSTGHLFGTLSFMSPEQARGQELTPASDVFSLGTVLTFAATGTNPFRTDSAPATLLRVVDAPPVYALADLPSDLRELITSCWQHTPEERPAPDDIITLLYGEDSGLDEQGLTAPPAPPETTLTLEPTTEPVSEAEPESATESAPKPEAEAEPEAEPEPTAMRHSMVPQASPPPETLERGSAPASETETEPPTISEPESDPEPDAEPRSEQVAAPEPESGPGPEPDTGPVTAAEPGTEPPTTPEPRVGSEKKPVLATEIGMPLAYEPQLLISVPLSTPEPESAPHEGTDPAPEPRGSSDPDPARRPEASSARTARVPDLRFDRPRPFRRAMTVLGVILVGMTIVLALLWVGLITGIVNP